MQKKITKIKDTMTKYHIVHATQGTVFPIEEAKRLAAKHSKTDPVRIFSVDPDHTGERAVVQATNKHNGEYAGMLLAYK